MTDSNTLQLLANEIIAYIHSRRDKKEEEFLKAKPKINKQGVITNGAINSRISAIIKTPGQVNGQLDTIEKSKKSKEQTALGFQQSKYRELLSLTKDNLMDDDLLDVKKEYSDFIISNNNEYTPETWLNQWTTKAKDISFATHVGKLTHSSSKSSSILDESEETNNCYLTTNTLSDIKIDTASSNAASLPISDILNLSVNSVSVMDCIKKNDINVFKKITDNESYIHSWCNDLKQSYDSTQKQSHFLSKQVYFPVTGSQYHLLLPLTSSSLVHELHLRHKRRWDTSQVEARDQRTKKRYSGNIIETFPNKAYIHVTGSNHSNASSLNGTRGGRISLLPTAPPQWESRLPRYVNKYSLFDKKLSFILKNEIDTLTKYLLLIKSKSLSISEPNRNAAVISKLHSISSMFFNYVDMINNNEALDGWTSTSNLPIEQQILCEPERMDDAAMATKKSTAWAKTLSQAYGKWLNGQLAREKQLTLTPIHVSLWTSAFLIDLREFIAVREVTI